MGANGPINLRPALRNATGTQYISVLQQTGSHLAGAMGRRIDPSW